MRSRGQGRNQTALALAPGDRPLGGRDEGDRHEDSNKWSFSGNCARSEGVEGQVNLSCAGSGVTGRERK